MLDWWFRLPPILRAAVAVVMIVVGVLLFWWSGSGRGMIGSRRGGGPAILIGVGIVLLFMSGPSDSEKKGYHF